MVFKYIYMYSMSSYFNRKSSTSAMLKMAAREWIGVTLCVQSFKMAVSVCGNSP